MFETLDATAQAELVRSGAVTATELVDDAIGRIELIDPAVHAVVSPLFDRARILAPTATGPFAGVPMVLKDAGQELAGTPHFVGTVALRNAAHHSVRTTSLAAKFEVLGFVIVGKGAVPELSAGVTTEPPGFEPTRSPWALDRTVGGSSGGPAAAVAAGLVPIAHGSDATGSLRFPASACGVVTLKPTHGRIAGEVPLGQAGPLSVWCDGVLTRSVRDLTSVFEHVRIAPAPLPPMSGSLRIGLLVHDPTFAMSIDPECVVAVERCGAWLEAMGHRVEMAFPAALGALADAFEPVDVVTQWSRARSVRAIEARIGRRVVAGELSESVLESAARGRGVTDADAAAAAVSVRLRTAPILDWWTGGFDVLVTPTMRRRPWRIGERADFASVGTFCPPFSFTGQPALSLPLHTTAEGLPVGVQLVGALGSDENLLSLAADLELAADWATRGLAPAGLAPPTPSARYA